MTDDVERVLFSAEEIAERTRQLGQEISRDYEGKEPIVAGILKGASLFLADLVRTISTPVRLDFMSVSSYGIGTKTSGTVKILKDLGEDIEGRHLLLVEDIIDSGLTMKRLIAELTKRDPADIRLAALLSKPSRREADVRIDYLGWEVPDEFLVGYGLDYAEKYRNLPFIGVLKREIYG